MRLVLNFLVQFLNMNRQCIVKPFCTKLMFTEGLDSQACVLSCVEVMLRFLYFFLGFHGIFLLH